VSASGQKPRRVILDLCLDKATAERWKASRGAERWKHVRIHKRMARAEGTWATMYVVVADAEEHRG
jgi:hypothetical protein